MDPRIARGEFDVKLEPLPSFSQGEAGIQLGRLSIVKTFSGDLSAQSRGEMLSAGGNAPGSAGYVAIEQVDGTLHGKQGTFVLQHNGIMERGQGRLTVEVVPDTGTGELAGLAGQFKILIEGDKHLYEFEYRLP